MVCGHACKRGTLPSEEKRNAHVACDENEFDTPALEYPVLILAECTVSTFSLYLSETASK